MLLEAIPDPHRTAPWVQGLLKLIADQAQPFKGSPKPLRLSRRPSSNKEMGSAASKNFPSIRNLDLSRRQHACRSEKPDKNLGSSADVSVASMQKLKEEKVIAPLNAPSRARFKEYTTCELELIPKEVAYRLEVWQNLEGKITQATLPKESKAPHFRHQLRALLHYLYSPEMTQPGLFAPIRSCGIETAEVKGISEESLKGGVSLRAPKTRKTKPTMMTCRPSSKHALV